MKPKKVLMLAAVDFPPDPRIERYMLALKELNYEVSLLCLKGNNSKEWNDIKIYRLPFSEFEKSIPKPFCWFLDYLLFLIFGTLATYLLVFFKNYKILHYHNPPDFNVIFLAPLKLFGIKLIYDAHEVTYLLAQSRLPQNPISNMIVATLKFFQAAALKVATSIITVNSTARKYLNKLHKRKIEIVENIPRPFKIPNFQAEQNTFIYAGAFISDRDIDTLLSAFNTLKKTNKSAQLWLVGSTNLKNTKNIKVFGKLSHEQTIKLITKASVVVISAIDNFVNRIGASNRAYEASYMGKAIIAADLPSFRKILGDSCIYYKPSNVKSLLKAMKFFLNKKNVQIYAQKAKKHFAKNYSWEKVKLTIQKIYGAL